MSLSLLGAFLITGLALLNRFPGGKARAFVGVCLLPLAPLLPLSIMLESGEPLHGGTGVLNIPCVSCVVHSYPHMRCSLLPHPPSVFKLSVRPVLALFANPCYIPSFTHIIDHLFFVKATHATRY